MKISETRKQSNEKRTDTVKYRDRGIFIKIK